MTVHADKFDLGLVANPLLDDVDAATITQARKHSTDQNFESKLSDRCSLHVSITG